MFVEVLLRALTLSVRRQFGRLRGDLVQCFSRDSNELSCARELACKLAKLWGS